jgi:hypothetical protein
MDADRNLIANVDKLIALGTRAGEQRLVADNAIRVATLKYVTTPGQLHIALETGEVAGMPAATHRFREVLAENKLAHKKC